MGRYHTVGYKGGCEDETCIKLHEVQWQVSIRAVQLSRSTSQEFLTHLSLMDAIKRISKQCTHFMEFSTP
jgi:hypothetical protein